MESTNGYFERFIEQTRLTIRYLLKHIAESGHGLPLDEQAIALNILDLVLERPELWPEISQLLFALDPIMEQQGERAKWIDLLTRSIKQSEICEDTASRAQLNYNLATQYQRCNHLQEALQRFKASEHLFAGPDQQLERAKALNRQAYVARLQRNYDDAERLAHSALALLEAGEPEQAYSYFVQGAIAFDQNNWTMAEDFFQQALDLWESTNDKRMIAWNLSNLGVVMRQRENYPKAIEYYNAAIKLLEEISDPVYQSITRMNLGNVYLMMEQPRNAIELYTQAETVFKRSFDELHLAMIYTNMGIAYRDLQQWEWATSALLKSIEGWQQIGNIESMTNAVEELGIVYLRQGLHKQAIVKFHDALNWLGKIKDEPGYAPLLASITENLCEAQRQQRDLSLDDKRGGPPGEPPTQVT